MQFWWMYSCVYSCVPTRARIGFLGESYPMRRHTLHVYLRQRYLKKTQTSIQEYIIAGFYIRTLYFVKTETFFCISKHGITIVQFAILTATRQFHGRLYFFKGKHCNCTHFILWSERRLTFDTITDWWREYFHFRKVTAGFLLLGGTKQ